MFQQRGAPPHIKSNVDKFLEGTFLNDRAMSRFSTFWPPVYPDQTPVDARSHDF